MANEFSDEPIRRVINLPTHGDPAIRGKAYAHLTQESDDGDAPGLYICTDKGDENTPSTWESIIGLNIGAPDIGDVSGLTAALAGKQNELQSGINIKTINGQSILGSGDLVISGGSGGGLTVFQTVADAWLTASGLAADATERNAALQLALDVTAIWDKIILLNPLRGAALANKKYNFVDPVDADSAYRLTFIGSAAAHAKGVSLPTLTDGIDTNLVGGDIFTFAPRFGIGWYQQYSGYQDFNSGATPFQVTYNLGGVSQPLMWTPSAGLSIGVSGQGGFHFFQRISTGGGADSDKYQYFRDGILTDDETIGDGTYSPTGTTFKLMGNDRVRNHILSCIVVTKQLTTSEQVRLRNALETYFTALGVTSNARSNGIGIRTAVHQIDVGRTGGGVVSGWSQDAYVTGGATFSGGGVLDSSNTVNPPPAAIGDTGRYSTGTIEYDLPGFTPGASCLIRVHYYSLGASAYLANRRNFYLNDVLADSDFLPTSPAGGGKLVIYEYEAEASGTGHIKVKWIYSGGGGDSPDIRGLEAYQ